MQRICVRNETIDCDGAKEIDHPTEWWTFITDAVNAWRQEDNAVVHKQLEPDLNEPHRAESVVMKFPVVRRDEPKQAVLDTNGSIVKQQERLLDPARFHPYFVIVIGVQMLCLTQTKLLQHKQLEHHSATRWHRPGFSTSTIRNRTKNRSTTSQRWM